MASTTATPTRNTRTRRPWRTARNDIARALGAATRIAARAAAPHRASLANLRAIPLTFAGTGCIDYAAFHLAGGWGWLVTGLSLIVLEHVIADDQ